MVKEHLRQKDDSITFFEASDNEPDRFLSWLKREKPDVVVALLHPIPDWIRKAGYAIPSDLEIVVLDNDHEMILPGVEQNFKMVGAAAMNLLHSNLLQGESGIPEHRQTLLVQPRWMEASGASHQTN
jgi:DNA-binding LacI/PurR family transcriptional regulator